MNISKLTGTELNALAANNSATPEDRIAAVNELGRRLTERMRTGEGLTGPAREAMIALNSYVERRSGRA